SSSSVVPRPVHAGRRAGLLGNTARGAAHPADTARGAGRTLLRVGRSDRPAGRTAGRPARQSVAARTGTAVPGPAPRVVGCGGRLDSGAATFVFSCSVVR